MSDFDMMLEKKRADMKKRRKKKDIDLINDNDDAIARLIADMRLAARNMFKTNYFLLFHFLRFFKNMIFILIISLLFKRLHAREDNELNIARQPAIRSVAGREREWGADFELVCCLVISSKNEY